MSGSGRLSRRHLLAGSAGAGVALAATRTGPAAWAAPTTPALTPTNLGPAVTGLGFANGMLVGRELWLGASRMNPARVVGYDFDRGTVTKSVELTGVAGVWGVDHVGTDLYVATYTPGMLFRIDTVTGAVTDIVDLGESVVWNVKASPDGRVFAGTYPSAELWEYDPATGTATNHGTMMDGETYLRDLAASETTVYCGIGSHPGLVAFDRASNSRTDIMPSEFDDLSFVSVLQLSGDTLLAGSTPRANLAMINTADPSDHTVIPIPNDEPYVTALYGHDDDVWVGTTKSNTIWHTHLGDSEVTPVTTLVSAPYRMGHLDDDHLWIAEAGGGTVLDLRTGDLEPLPLLSDLVQPSPQKPMTLHWADRRVFVPGSGVLAIHADDGRDSPATIATKGEVKDLASAGGELFGGIYTLSLIGRMATDAVPDAMPIVSRLDKRYEQTRPLDIAVDGDGNRLLIGTEPDYGRWEGAFSWMDLADEEVTTVRGILSDQSVSAVCAAPGGAWIGGSIRNGYGTVPTRSTAQVAFVATDGTVVRTAEPLPDTYSWDCLLLHDRLLLGSTRAGELVCLDARGLRVLWTVDTGSRGTRFTRLGSRLVGTDGDRLWSVALVGGREPQVEVWAEGLAAQWFGTPTVTSDGRSAVFTLQGLDLVRFDLS